MLRIKYLDLLIARMIEINSKTDRIMARIAIVIFSIGAIFAFWAFGRPLYWRFYATTLRPFEDPTLSRGSDEANKILDEPLLKPATTSKKGGEFTIHIRHPDGS